ncbi:hypothetical protein TEA_001956 [Camellia sinensis var. sinensis]|uniref:Serine-threonine/tyrosine-protein kinase catalytic domain-containing protein n=1 Tax=Camellia sinensis var. sinensis TaxID=542762 RepID=A0A4V3WM04_CAMSN|nr:hypothetical protein TEA_001956 [Camellia sinensis var. sinensis]
MLEVGACLSAADFGIVVTQGSIWGHIICLVYQKAVVDLVWFFLTVAHSAALDEDRSEENRYLAKWFWTIKSNREKLFAAIDPALAANEEIFDSICIIAELAGHCTARDPNHRPNTGYAVNVLAPLVENWKPFAGEREKEYFGIVYDLPLPELLKGWQEAKTKDFTGASQNDSK